jgi:photosystem II stability/assembly factor-like uncharacterized protein
MRRFELAKPIACRSNALALAMACWLVANGFLTALAPANPAASPPQMLEDAELADVFFLDADRGWAVGDRGVIWATEDGGRHWRLADSPVNCRLESVYFVDDVHGWIVGGWRHAYTCRSSAVVLRTTNGGRRWTLVDVPTLPALKRVRFLDQLRGWAVGQASPMYGSGVFRTEDGGRSWTAVAGLHEPGWLSADFRNARHGVAVGRNRAVASVTQSELQLQPASTRGWGHLHAVRLDASTGWVVGDGGTVLFSADDGATWHPPSGSLPPRVDRQFDWRCVAAIDQQCWIAGAPGTRILHTADRGASWQLLDTHQSVPLRALCFVNAQRGWAVGSLGTILATRDGGKTWQRQKGLRRRAALLAVVSEPDRMPLELLTRLSGDEGFIGVVEILNRRDIAPAASPDRDTAARAHAAVTAVGGSQASVAWRFPLRQPGLQVAADSIVRGWELANGEDGIGLLEEHVVRCIRQWRPEIVVTENASPYGDDPLAHLVNQVVLNATARAAAADAFPQQLSTAGLTTWQPKKVFARARDGKAGSVTLETTRLATRLGGSVDDFAALARGLVGRQWRSTPATLSYQLLTSEVPAGASEHDFFSGLAIAAGCELRRDLSTPVNTSLEQLSRIAQKRRNIRALIKRDLTNDGRVGWLAQIDDLTGGLSPEASGEILFELAMTYHLAGRTSLTTDVLRLLVERYPDHPLVESSLMWLVQYYGSDEVSTWLDEGHWARPRYLANRGDAPTNLAQPPRTPTNQPSTDPALLLLPPVDSEGYGRGVAHRDRDTYLASLGHFIRQTRPALFADPEIQFPVAAALRGHPQAQAESIYEGLLRSELPERWKNCARGELWLAHGKGQPPKPILSCPRVQQRPYLDGHLDESFWQDADAVQLQSVLQDDQQWPADVLLAHDSEFLYLAARCRKAPGVTYRPSDEPRVRDSNLTTHDRVDFLFDIDRDYATFFQLTVDHRGWARDSCVGDPSWDPQWFVAVDSNAETWVIEAAISLGDLTSRKPAARDAWAVGVQRTVPQVGFQSWSRPAGVEVRPEGFGHLVFE